MPVTTVVLPDTNEEKVSLGFMVKLDSETAQLDQIYRGLQGIKGARVEFLDGKKLRVDLPVVKQK